MARGTAFWRKIYYDLAFEVEQVLGKALGYPKYSDDQKNFPGSTEKDGVCVGDHVPESLVSEAASTIEEGSNNTSIKKQLQSFLDRSWKDEDLTQTASLVGNAIYWRDEQIKELNRRIVNFKNANTKKFNVREWPAFDAALPTWKWEYYTPPAIFGGVTNSPKSLVFSEKDNVPCTAEIEVAFEKLASYFEKRAKENIKSSDNLEQGWFAKHFFPDLLSSYYHSGKADSYKRAAEKVREILGK